MFLREINKIIDEETITKHKAIITSNVPLLFHLGQVSFEVVMKDQSSNFKAPLDYFNLLK